MDEVKNGMMDINLVIKKFIIHGVHLCMLKI